VLALVLGAATVALRDSRHEQRQIKTTKLSGNFYTLEGNGGTIGVLTGPTALDGPTPVRPPKRKDRVSDQASSDNRSVS